jgi:pilus assembly protein CpaE
MTRDLQPGRVIAVYGAKRGVGTTTVACNLALALRSATGADVALVDGEQNFGGVSTMMGLPARHCQAPLVEHDSGVLVAAPEAGGLDVLVDEARRRAEWVVVDTPSLLTPASVRVLQRSERVLLVVTPEEAALRHAHAFLDYCAERDLASDVRVVVNRSGSQSAVPIARLEELFGRRLLAHLESNGRLVVAAVNNGEPFVSAQPEQRLSVQVRQLARSLVAA